MNQDPVAVARIDWLRIFPSLNLVRAARLGFRVRVIAPSFLLLLLMWGGQHLICLTSASDELIDCGKGGWQPRPLLASYSEQLFSGPSMPESGQAAAPQFTFDSDLFPIPVWLAIGTLRSILISRSDFGHSATAFVWVILATAVCGTAVARSVATDFCTQTRTGAFSAVKFSAAHWRAYLLATCLTCFLIGLPFALLRAVAWLVSFTDIGQVLAAVCWPLIYLLAFCSILTSAIVGMGWLLSLSAIGTDRCSGADALSRGINYVLSHKLKTVGYLTWVLLTGVVCRVLTQEILHATSAVLEPLFGPASGATAELMSNSWTEVIHLLPSAIQTAVFLAGSTLIYILLRQAEDAVHLRELDGGRTGGDPSAHPH